MAPPPSTSSKKKKKGEIQVQKSPAEFFAENQAIAGFDNLGKSLYTSIRELVENSLDATESIGILPDISVHITEYTEAQFNNISGLGESPRKNQKDSELFQSKADKKKAAAAAAVPATLGSDEAVAAPPPEEPVDMDGKKKKSRRKSASQQEAYFLITVKDNGCGMDHDAIPNLLGRVLSGSKYGVRQTRGKFGLGAKMALIWSKKSTGQPIRVKTSHRPDGGGPPSHVSTCCLDIDIYKNEPRVMEHTKSVNKEEWIGTEFELLIAGNWTTYKARIVQYLNQLAIITPYAALQLTYENKTDPKRNMNIRYDRRSEQMPPPAQEVKHHPESVNNLLIQQLVQFTRCQTMVRFLSTELAAVSPALAKRLIAELASSGLEESMHPSELTDKQINRLVQLFRQVKLFRPPDGSCLSPLGEYNLNLGIRKVLEPDLIATARDKPCAYEGHPFVVEAAVSLGGKEAKEGITVVRFANRIPMLFEGGADVSTRVAQTKIRWSNYKIDHKQNKVGVFVSIVSTKIPFKGTSKEYIGDDCTEVQLSVKRALQSCCQQLRVHLMKRSALKDAQTRKSRLTKYVPDVTRSLFGLLEGMRKRAPAQQPTAETGSPTKRLRLDQTAAQTMIQRLNRGEITEARIHQDLTQAIEDQIGSGDAAGAADGTAGNGTDEPEEAFPLFLVPLYNLDDPQHDICHPLFTFRPILPISRVISPQHTNGNDSN
jgi:DNA topoisomerase-6 subunit B